MVVVLLTSLTARYTVKRVIKFNKYSNYILITFLSFLQNSALYHHLQEAGFSHDDINAETLSSAYTLAEHELQRQSAQKEREEEERRKRQRVKVTGLHSLFSFD